MIKYLFSLLLNESGKGGSGNSVTTTSKAPLTASEAELNEMQIQRTKADAARMAELFPARSTAMEADIGLRQQKFSAQQTGAGEVQKYLTGTDLTKARGILQQEIIQDVLDKVKGNKSYVSDKEKTKLKTLESSYTQEGTKGIQSLQAELEDRTGSAYGKEGLISSGLYKRLLNEEAKYQTGTIGRSAGMQSAQTLMNLPAQNRLNLAGELESAQKLGQQARWGRMNVLGTAAGNVGGAGGGRYSGAGQGLTGSGSLSSTLSKLDQARQSAATQTTTQSSMNKGDMATQGALGGAQAGLTLGSGLGAGFAALGAGATAGSIAAAGAVTGGIGLIIGLGLGAIYGYNS